MKKYNITCYLTSKGWQIEHDYDKMQDEPVRMQRDFHTILDTLSEKMSRRDDTPAQFKIKLSFMPCEDRRHYRQRIDFKQTRLCPSTYAHYGLELFNNLSDELMKERED